MTDQQAKWQAHWNSCVMPEMEKLKAEIEKLDEIARARLAAMNDMPDDQEAYYNEKAEEKP